MANFHPELYRELFELYQTETEAARRLQDFIGFCSVVECQMYPVNAKYYLGTLEGLGFGYGARTRNAREFTRNRQLEIEQMWALTQMWKNRENMQNT